MQHSPDDRRNTVADLFSDFIASGKEIKIEVPTPKKGDKADVVTVKDVHVCCGQCQTAINNGTRQIEIPYHQPTASPSASTPTNIAVTARGISSDTNCPTAKHSHTMTRPRPSARIPHFRRPPARARAPHRAAFPPLSPAGSAAADLVRPKPRRSA